MAESNERAVEKMKAGLPQTTRPKVGEPQDGAAQAFADLKGKYVIIDVRSGHNPMNQGEVQYSIRLVGVEKDRLRTEVVSLPSQEIGLRARLIAGISRVVDVTGKPVEVIPKETEKEGG